MNHLLATPRLARTLWVLTLALASLVVWNTEFRADFSAFLPRQPRAEQQLLVEQLQHGAAARVLLVGVEGSEPKVLAELGRRMAAGLRGDPLYSQVHNGESHGYAADTSLLMSSRYLLSPQVSARQFSSENLHRALQDGLADLGVSTGLMSKDLFARDPTGELQALLAQWLPSSGPRLLHGHWFNPSGSRALLLVETRAAGSDMDGQELAIARIREAFERSQREIHAAASVRLLLSGPGVFAVDAREAIRGEAMRLSMISMTLIVGLLLLIYRSLPALALGLLPVFTGALVGVAAVSLGFGVVHGMTLGFGITLIGEAVDYAIYLFVQHSGSQDRTDFARRFWPTLRLGMLTSVCGFGALLLSGFSGLAQLGLYSTAGLLAAALTTRWVLPGLLPASFRVRDVAPLGRRLQDILPHLRRVRPALLVLACAAALLLGWRHASLWNHELSALSPVPHSTQMLDAQLRADLGAADVRHLIVLRGSDAEVVLQRCEALLPGLHRLVADGQLDGYDAPCRYLPSLAMQRTRQLALPDEATLARHLEQARQGLPIRADFLAPFRTDVETARHLPLLRPDDVQSMSFAAALNATLTQADDHAVGLVQLRAPASGAHAFEIDISRLRTALGTQLDAQAVLLDLKTASGDMYRDYLNQALLLSALGLAGIAVLMFGQLHKLRRVIAVFLPLLASVVLVTASLHLFGVRLNLLHLVGLLLTVAVGSNYALFFDQNGEATPEQLPRTMASLLLANLTTVFAFGLLALSHVPVLQAIGVTVGPGAMLALLCAAILSQPSRHE